MKKTKIIISSFIIFGAVASLITFNDLSFKGHFETNGELPTYGIEFSSKKNKPTSSSGTLNAITNNNATIQFSYANYVTSSGWGGFSSNGYIGNDFIRDEYNNNINSLTNIKVNFTGVSKLTLTYGWYDNEQISYSLSSNETYNFGGNSPTHFKITNSTSYTAVITSFVVNYTCVETPVDISDEHLGTYKMDLGPLTKESLEEGYSKAISMTDSQLKNYSEIELDYEPGDFNVTDTISFNGNRKNSRRIVINGNDTKIRNGDTLSTGGWSLYQNGIYVKDIGVRNKFSTLLVNDESKQLARTKTMQAVKYDDDNEQFRFKKSVLKNATGLTSLSGNMSVVMEERWAGCHAIVSSIETTTLYYNLSFIDTCKPYMFNTTRNYRDVNNPYFFLLNNLSFLDEEGEWYYDDVAGNLYYKPVSGTNINESTFTIPTAEVLVDTSRLVDDVTFKNISFLGTDYAAPLSQGFYETQATANIDTISGKHQIPKGLINIASIGTRFENCLIHGSGGTGVYVSADGVDISFTSCTVSESKGCGFFVGDLSKKAKEQLSENVTIENCCIKGYGRLYRGAIGIQATYVDRLNIIHNTVCDGAYSGITAGWGWTTNPTYSAHNRYTISYNHITNVVDSMLYDGAPIYVLGAFMNEMGEVYNEIAHNYLEYTRGLGVIYLDESSSSWHIHHNACCVLDYSSDTHFMGTIFNHNPIHDTSSYYTVCNSNIIEDNYAYGKATWGHSTYTSSGGQLTSSQLEEFYSSHSIQVTAPSLTDNVHANEEILAAAGCSLSLNKIFESKYDFLNAVNVAANDLEVNNTGKTATFTCPNHFDFAAHFMSSLYREGYRTMSFDIKGNSTSETPIGSFVVVTSGTVRDWKYYNQDVKTSEGETKTITIDLNKFDLEKTALRVYTRDSRGISTGDDLASKVTISNLKLSKFTMPTVKSGSIQLLSENNNVTTYKVSGLSYNWNRVYINGMKSLHDDSDVSSVTIVSEGQKHNMYVMYGDTVQYANELMAGKARTTINIDGSSDVISIMTSHETLNKKQDDTGVLGTTEDFIFSIYYGKTFDNSLFSSTRTVSKLFTTLTISNYVPETQTITFSSPGTFTISEFFISYCRENGYKSFSFDVKPEQDSECLSIVLVNHFSDETKNATSSYRYTNTYKINASGIITVSLSTSQIYGDPDFIYTDCVCREIENGYGGKKNVPLNDATISNFKFSK